MPFPEYQIRKELRLGKFLDVHFMTLYVYIARTTKLNVNLAGAGHSKTIRWVGGLYTVSNPIMVLPQPYTIHFA